MSFPYSPDLIMCCLQMFSTVQVWSLWEIDTYPCPGDSGSTRTVPPIVGQHAGSNSLPCGVPLAGICCTSLLPSAKVNMTAFCGNETRPTCAYIQGNVMFSQEHTLRLLKTFLFNRVQKQNDKLIFSFNTTLYCR